MAYIKMETGNNIIEKETTMQEQQKFTVSNRLNGVGEYFFSKKLREIDALNREGKNIINLGIGSPDMPPHKDVIDVLHEESRKPTAHAYQNYKGSPILRKAFAEWYKEYYSAQLDPDTEILPLIGSKEGIMHICMTYLNPGDAVLIPNPGYPTYRSAVTLAGGVCADYHLHTNNNFYPDFDELGELVKNNSSLPGRSVKAMFINYPHMPTGAKADKAIFEKLVHFAHRHHILLIHDNPYSFILNDEPVSILSIAGAKDVCIELNSLSKSHNMAGWRAGVMCASKEMIDDVLRFKSNMDSGMFLPVQLAAAKALQLGREWYNEVNEVYARRREKVFMLLDAIGCIYSKKQSGLFVWSAVPPLINDMQNHPLGRGGLLSDSVLHNAHVFITPGGIFGSAGNDFIRISLCAMEDKIEEAIIRIQSAGNAVSNFLNNQ